MKTTGIIMSGDHPQLIQDGLKTMTRRVIKDPRRKKQGFMSIAQYGEGRPSVGDLQRELELTKDTPPNFPCPYGEVGDLLRVRETWRTYRIYDNNKPSEIRQTAKVWYKTTALGDKTVDFDQQKDGAGKWRPSLFMPRWASRIERTIALLRAERLRDISKADAQAEGGYTIEEFIRLYLKINHLPEDANPWNWVIGF